MKKLIIFKIFCLCFWCLDVNGQKADILKADQKYQRYAYIDAIKSYERIVEKGYKSPDLYEKIANAYFYNAKLDKAAHWYGLLIAANPDINPEYYFRYANCLRSIGNMTDANTMLETYNKKSIDNKGQLYSRDISFMKRMEMNSGRYRIKDAGINTPYSDYGAAILNDSVLVFTSARDTNKLAQRKHSWTNQSFTRLYQVKLYGDSLDPGQASDFSNTLKSKFNDASAVFTKDGKTMYFTRNNTSNIKKSKDNITTVLLKLYKAEFIDGDWKEVQELPFNSDNYNTAHPALSPDDKELYFVSDMPGTLGNSDIFKVSIHSDGTYGKPTNLGPEINTPGRETFPFISLENELYFASDTHSGLGGLDIFISDIDTEDGSFGEVQNLGRGINSNHDDFAYQINSVTRRGFFSSNREGKGFDDIYKFLENRRIIKPFLSGVISDKNTGEILPNSKVLLYNNIHKVIDSALADENGRYEFPVRNTRSYTVTAEKEEYGINGKSIKIPPNVINHKLDLTLERDKCKISIGGDLAKCFNISMIYFDLDKSNIRPDAAIDLAKILDVLIEYPTMKIDIRSHTDSRASFKYNEALSDRRAKSTRAWLIEKGINPNRLTAKGYGEYELVNRCADNIPCTEEEHQQNRRSEFIVTAL